HPEREFRRLLTFLGVPPEEGPAAFFASNRINSSFRPNSKDRAWVQQLAEPWKEWTEEQSRVFAEEAGETLVRGGFAAAGSLAAPPPPGRGPAGGAGPRAAAVVPPPGGARRVRGGEGP